MITRVYFVRAEQGTSHNSTMKCYRVIEFKSFFSPKMSVVLDKVLMSMSETTGMPREGWDVTSFSRVV